MTFLSRRSRTTRVATVTAVQQQHSAPDSAAGNAATRQAPCSYWVRRRLQSESRSS